MRFSKLLHPSILLIAIPVLLLLTTWLPLSARAPHPDTQGASAQTVPAYTQTLIEVSDGVSGDNFGAGVALDGDLLAVGAIGVRLSGQPAGAVYLYERDPQSPSGWTEIHRLYGDPGLISPYFGYALALQGDTLIVGAPFHPRDGGRIQGKAYVYERHQGGTDAWGLVTELEDEEDADGRWFGRSVAFDGDLVAVSAVGAEDDRGKVYLYGRAAGWTRIKEFSDPDGQPRDWFGSALALQGDTLVIGAQAADLDTTTTDTGAAFVYGRDQGGADQWDLVARLVADEPQFDSFFGNSLALDGDTIVVGANSEDRYEAGQPVASQVGAAYVYGRDQGGADAWGLLASLRPEDGETLDRFGASVAVSGDDLWVGAPYLDTGGFGNEGALFHYRRDEGGPSAWGLLDTIQADPDSSEATFGSALAAEGQTLLAGAPYHELKGAAYIIVPGDPPGEPNTAYLSLVLKWWLPPTGTLEDGGSLESPAGAIIGAVPGTLDAPLLTTIEETRPPAEPLPNGFLPRGEHYYLAAERLAIAPADKPLLVGLPVPNAADTTRLGAALYVPDFLTSETTTSTDTSTRSWTTAAGSYDPATNLFVITVRALMPEGVTLVLYEHPHNAPLPLPDVAARQPQGQTEYIVKCDPEAQYTAACTPANYQLVADQMEAIHDEYVDTYGFKIPALPRSAGAFVEPDKEPVLYETAANVVIASKPCLNPKGEPISGYYAAYAAKLLICFDDPDNAGQRYRIMRHELFHAVLASYPIVIDDFYDDYYRPRTHWLLEGATAAAETSGPAMFRSPDYSLRQVTTPLTSTLEKDPYQMQDFWVYTGWEGGQPDHDLSYLKPILDKGATPEHVAQAMPLADDYWNWVKNQAIEHYQTMDGAFEKGACELEPAAIDPAATNILNYPNQISVQGHIPPMSTALVEIHFTGNVLPSNMPVIAENDTVEADMRHKVYIEGEEGCRDKGDGDRILIDPSATDKIYVLISNVSLTDPFNYIVQVD